MTSEEHEESDKAYRISNHVKGESDEETSRNRAESSIEGGRRTGAEGINKTKGNALPNFPIDKDTKKGRSYNKCKG